jgi:hypothetical protein
MVRPAIAARRGALTNRLKHYFFTRDDEASSRGIALDVPGWRKAAGVTSESKSSITAATVEIAPPCQVGT